MELNWELCRVFYHVARCRNFSRAAAMLFTSQPAVSRSMAALERELGCRLFIRNRRGVELTPEGRMFYAHVEAGCEQFRRGREELEQAVGLQSGSIAVGASETALRVWVLPRLKRFHALYPGVKMRLYGGTSRQAVEELKSGAIDFAVAAVSGEDFHALKETRLCAFSDVFIASPAFEELRNVPLSLADVMSRPVICHKRGSLTFDFLENLCKKNGLEFDPAMEPDTSELVLELVRHGFGIGFLLVKMRLSGVNLTWNENIPNGKLTAEEAKTFDFGATLSYDGVATDSQESVSYLYSGFTSKWRVYSSTTTPPTEPGRYVMTVVTLGGNYQAAPIPRSFQITK